MLFNIDPKKFLDPSYVFEITPTLDNNIWYLAGIFGFFVILALIFWFWYGRKSKSFPLLVKMQGRMFNIFFYCGIIGLILVFFRWQQIPYLASRFFILLLILIFLVWLGLILYWRFYKLSQEITKYCQKEQFEKYLPKNKE